jgi:hypothetical protein
MVTGLATGMAAAEVTSMPVMAIGPKSAGEARHSPSHDGRPGWPARWMRRATYILKTCRDGWPTARPLAAARPFPAAHAARVGHWAPARIPIWCQPVELPPLGLCAPTFASPITKPASARSEIPLMVLRDAGGASMAAKPPRAGAGHSPAQLLAAPGEEGRRSNFCQRDDDRAV